MSAGDWAPWELILRGVYGVDRGPIGWVGIIPDYVRIMLGFGGYCRQKGASLMEKKQEIEMDAGVSWGCRVKRLGRYVTTHLRYLVVSMKNYEALSGCNLALP